MNETKKPLYLSPASTTRVLLDGPALRIRQANRADQLCPINQISRIIVSGTIHWDTEALLKCAEQNIPIHFMKKKGQARAHLVPALDKPDIPDINDVVKQYLHMPNYHQRFRSWSTVQRFFACRKLANALHVNYHKLYDKGIENTLVYKLRHEIRPRQCRIFERHCREYLLLEIADALRDRGIDPQNQVMELAHIHLSQELTYLCHAHHIAPMARYLRRQYHLARKKGLYKPDITALDAINCFEYNKHRLLQIFDTYYREFFNHMLDSLRDHALQT